MMRSLQHSKTRTWSRLSENLKEKLKLRTFLRRLKDGRLGISKATKRNDVCSVCHAWDDKVQRRLDLGFKECFALLRSKCETFWNDFEEDSSNRCEKPS